MPSTSNSSPGTASTISAIAAARPGRSVAVRTSGVGAMPQSRSFARKAVCVPNAVASPPSTYPVP